MPTASDCPVCPFASLSAYMLSCPSCGTDLTVLRRVQELPLIMLNDAIRLARGGDVDGARRLCCAASSAPATRAAALALLAKYELRAGRPWAALRSQRAARRAMPNAAGPTVLPADVLRRASAEKSLRPDAD
jgi:hypothetical protein